MPFIREKNLLNEGVSAYLADEEEDLFMAMP
jgi:hypothetical protein